MGKYKKAKKEKLIKSESAFNIRYPFYLLGVIIWSWGIVYLLLEEYKFSWILMFLWLISTALLFLDSVYYVFTKNEICFVHFWGYKKRIPWLYVTSVIEHDYLSYHRWTYEVYYKKIRNGKVIMYTTYLPTTPKIKRYMYKYYSKTTVGVKKKKR